MMQSILPFAFPAPAADPKIARDIAIPEPIPVPAPDITTPGGGIIPGISTGSGSTSKPTTTTGALSNVIAAALPALTSIMGSSGSGGGYSPKSSAESGASNNQSGDAYSKSTFGDFIVNGSKGTSLSTILIIGGSVIAAIVLIKTLSRKK